MVLSGIVQLAEVAAAYTNSLAGAHRMVALIGLIVAAIALVIPFAIEILKRPRLEVVPATWRPHRTLPFTFASAGVRNKPLPKLLGRLLSRDVAQACEIFIDYYKWEHPDAKLFDSIQGRWDSHPQPERSISRENADTRGVGEPGNPDAGGLEERMEFAPSLDSSNQEDIVSGSDRGQVSVAILTAGGEAFAFANQSYAYGSLLGNPAWKLPMGTYRVVIRVRASNVNREECFSFRLEYLSEDFAKFQLKAIA
jgi:hypothetical protein